MPPQLRTPLRLEEQKQDGHHAEDGLLRIGQQAVFGVVIILFLIFEPKGLSKLWGNVKDYFHVWPFAYRRG